MDTYGTHNIEKTRQYLNIVFTLIVLVIILILGLGFLTARYIDQSRNQESQMQSDIQNITQTYRRVGDFLRGEETRIETLLERRELRPRIGRTSYIVLNRRDEIIFENILENPDFETLQEENEFYRENDTIVFIRNIGNNKVIFYQSLRYGPSDLRRDIFLFLLVSIFLSLLCFILGKILIRQLLSPIEQSYKDMQSFTHTAGHELKTPLAVMRGNLQIMEVEKSFDVALIKNSIDSVDKMNLLIETLRKLSDIGISRNIEKFDIIPCIESVIQSYKKEATKKSLTFELALPKVFYIESDLGEFTILLQNLISNAIKYNNHTGKVMIAMRKNIFKISDTGRGIEKDNLDKIFSYLYRENTHDSIEGYGIGLSLVDKIVKLNNWKIVVKSKVGVGTSFEITM